MVFHATLKAVMVGLLLCSSAFAAEIEVHFSPNGGCTAAVDAEIAAAKHLILVQAYSFTSEPIAAALIAAKKRGVMVRIVLDRSQQTARYTRLDEVVKAGILTLIDSKHAIAHNKIMIIDGAVVITGSFNFTGSAESRNAENLLVIRDSQLAEVYSENWFEHEAHSVRATSAE